MSTYSDSVSRLLLVKGGHVFTPDDVGACDILCFGDRILSVERQILPPSGLGPVEVIDARGMRVLPGLIDQHVHFLGGGDGQGPEGRVPELHLGDLTTAGITTAVGLLGVDMETKTLPMLLRKAHELERQGLTTFIYTGAMRLPPPFLTTSVRSDIILIEKVIGVKCAIAEPLYPNRDPARFAELAGEGDAGSCHLGKGGGPAHTCWAPRRGPGDDSPLGREGRRPLRSRRPDACQPRSLDYPGLRARALICSQGRNHRPHLLPRAA
jgi:beta-aspartyl-dipeptidase (metallo-type)